MGGPDPWTADTGLAFFGSLGDRAHAILHQFSDDELLVIARFITAMAESVRQQVQDTEHGPEPPG